VPQVKRKNRNLPESKASSRYFKNNRRNRRDNTRTGKKKRGRQEIHEYHQERFRRPDDTMEMG